MALSHPSSTSNSWLKAISRACLGLVISEPEFIISLRICLGASFFPVYLPFHH